MAAVVLALSSPAGAQESTSEILIGYNTEQDRRDAEKELAGAKDKLKVRGQSLESLQVQQVSDKALKLQIGLPQAVKAEIAKTPAAQTAILQGLADQLKRSDKRIAYAHPNWVMTGMPPAARASSLPMRKQSSPVPVARKVSSASARKHAKRVAKKSKRHFARKRSYKRLAAPRRCRRESVWVMPCGARSRVAWHAPQFRPARKGPFR
jgi:hypothetical protein